MTKPEKFKVGDQVMLDGKKRKVALPPASTRFQKGNYFVPVMFEGDRNYTDLPQNGEYKVL